MRIPRFPKAGAARVTAFVALTAAAVTVGMWPTRAHRETVTTTITHVVSHLEREPAAGLASDEVGFCALLRNGRARCWGDATDGKLGNGRHTDLSRVPVDVVGLTHAVQLVSDGSGYCALLRDGGVECWGSDRFGKLGDGRGSGFSSVPVRVEGLRNVKSLVADVGARGGYCALLAAGTAACWGSGSDGELGDGAAAPGHHANVPVAVDGLTDAVSLVSDRAGYCALLRGGRVKCWGANTFGALGDGSSRLRSARPVPVQGLKAATSLVGTYRRYCALVENGTVECWGDNEDGALGNGSNVRFSNIPVAVRGLDTAVSLTGGSAHGSSCAVVENRTAMCWGDNASGQLGDGHTEQRSNLAVRVKGVRHVLSLVSLANGLAHCALLSAGTASCWGFSVSRLSEAPDGVAGLTHAVELAASIATVCGLLDSGEVRCWGANLYGELGDGRTSESNVAVEVQTLGPARARR